MPFWKRSEEIVTDEQRLVVLKLATGEDFSLDEVVQRIGDLPTAQAVIDDLRTKKMVEFFWKRPRGGRDEIPPSEVTDLLTEDTEWRRKKSFEDPYVVVVANDKGWRWHQDRWTADKQR